VTDPFDTVREALDAGARNAHSMHDGERSLEGKAALASIEERLREVERELRREWWLGHGHTGMYAPIKRSYVATFRGHGTQTRRHLFIGPDSFLEAVYDAEGQCEMDEQLVSVKEMT
jgi:hypothetical protein